MTDLRGRVDLREPELPTSPSAYPSVPTGFSFELGSTQRTFVFCARSALELQEWLCHLRSQIARARAASSPGTATYAADGRGTANPSACGGEAVTAELGSSMRRVASRQAFGSEGRLSDEALKSDALTIDLGDEYEPLADVQMRPLGSSLMLLSRRPKFSPLSLRHGERPHLALGVVCEVRLVRGHRMLTVKSTVEVVNDTGMPLLLSAGGTGGRKGGEGETLLVPPHATLPLPLHFTPRGSDAAVLELAIRPEASHQWGQLVKLNSDTAILKCDPEYGAADAAAAAAGEAVGAWMCCAQLELLPHARHGANAVFSRRVLKQMRRFDLPHSEPLLQYYVCVLSIKGASFTAPCTLYLTPGYLCFHATLGGVAEALRWDEVEQIHASSARSIEVLPLPPPIYPPRPAAPHPTPLTRPDPTRPDQTHSTYYSKPTLPDRTPCLRSLGRSSSRAGATSASAG